MKPDTVVVMLIPARTDTSYFHDYIYHKAELRFIRGRLHFNEAPQGAPFPSMVVVYNNSKKREWQVMEEFAENLTHADGRVKFSGIW